jgi:hypothetical protein
MIVTQSARLWRVAVACGESYGGGLIPQGLVCDEGGGLAFDPAGSYQTSIQRFLWKKNIGIRTFITIR